MATELEIRISESTAQAVASTASPQVDGIVELKITEESSVIQVSTIEQTADIHVQADDIHTNIVVNDTVQPTELRVSEYVKEIVIKVEEVGIPGPKGDSSQDSQIQTPACTRAYITDFSSQTGTIVSDKLWAEPNRVIQTATTDAATITVHALVEASCEEYRPEVFINGTQVLALTEHSTFRWYVVSAQVPLNIGDNEILLESSGGARATASIHRVAGGPEVLGVTWDAPAVPSTHFKGGDSVAVTIHLNSSATEVTVFNYGACGQTITTTINTPGIAHVQIPISSLSVPTNLRLQAKNAFGTKGDEYFSDNLPIDQVLPTVSLKVAYPSGQYAIKQGERATITYTATNHSSYVWSSNATHLDQVSDSEFQCATTSGLLSTPVKLTVFKDANNSYAQATANVLIANQGPSLALSVVGNPSRLKRSPSGTQYSLQVVSDQPLMSLFVPGLSMSPSADRKTWTGTFKIYDSTPVTPYEFTANAIGAAGHPSSATRSFPIGGFSKREVTWPAFSRVAPLGLSVVNQSDVRVQVGSAMLNLQTSNVDTANGFYIANADGSWNPVGEFIGLSDFTFAMANTTGTLKGEVEEI